MAIKTVIHTNQSSIDRVLQAGLPVALVFWHAQTPMGGLDASLDQLAETYSGRLLIARVNAGEEAELARRYQVQQFPTFVFVKNGKVEATAPGAVDEQTLRQWVRYLVEGGPRPQQTAQANGAQTSAQPVKLTDGNFQQIVSGAQPVLVDFWAEWCGPCRMVAPSVEQLAREFAGRAVVGKLNVDENPQTAQRYNVMSIPTLFIFKNGEIVDRMVGAQPLPALRQWLSRHVR
jgi:thioredoxin 1